jgi:hypothetical protein
MLTLVQHLTSSSNDETLKQVQSGRVRRTQFGRSMPSLLR